MKENNVLISVLISAKNDEKYISETIESVLAQTVFDFELLVTDDGSTDGTLEVIRSFTDPRIHIFVNEESIGLPRSLNAMLKVARGKYIARLDGDDISLPKRFEKELNVLEDDPSVYMVCCKTELFGERTGISCPSTCFEQLKADMLFENPITHSSVMFRNDGLFTYDDNFLKSQDYDLWNRMIWAGKKIAVIDEVLVKYRIHPTQITASNHSENDRLTGMVYMAALKNLEITLDEKDERIYIAALRNGMFESSEDVDGFVSILNRIYENNERIGFYEKKCLRKAEQKQYFNAFKYYLSNMESSNVTKAIRLIPKVSGTFLIHRLAERIKK